MIKLDHINFFKGKHLIVGDLQFQRFSPLYFGKTWQHAGRHGAGAGAEMSTFLHLDLKLSGSEQ